MKRTLKILGYTLGSIIGFIILLVVGVFFYLKISAGNTARKCKALEYAEVKTLTIDGFTFRDLNKNGKLDVYEDARESVDDRVGDLLSQMTLEEKAGTMFINMVGINKDGSVNEKPSLRDPFSLLEEGTSKMLFMNHMNHLNILTGTSKKAMAEWYNNLQKLEERSRLGIPVTIASDPRNHFSSNPLASALSGDMTQFPEPLGLAAIGDSLEVAEFGNIARQEYLALGIRVALHPQADLATEPRWIRSNGTFGEDAILASKLVGAYIKGFQGDTLGPNSVVCMVKHFSGGGPQKEGIDSHLEIQKGQVYPGNNFDYHLLPFEAAFGAGAAEIMPYYGVPTGQTSEDVGFAFNKDIITGLLRDTYHFDGIVCTDWGIVTDMNIFGRKVAAARAWGMQNATEEERVLKIINAGVDQFGGESVPEIVVKLVEDGKVPMERIDESVSRLLKMKFRLGLFDRPFVDVENAVKVVGNSTFKAAGNLAQRKSIVLLKNDTIDKKAVLPLKKGINIYVENMDTEKAAKFGTVVDKPELADIAIIRLQTPSEKLPDSGVLGMLMRGGDLGFKGEEKEEILALLAKVPTIVDIYLNRAAVIPEISAASKGLFASFGADDNALLEIVFGDFNPRGKLPIEMPSSMDAVRKQKEDVPYDSENPLYKFGYGLSY
ncbi:MAG: glycoside hydrolase family 3 protein [Bacteroidia bacterium]|nr:MAG: glycoside hydrolase family 3 protein [Bacteroidia bacterium]